MRRKQVQKGSGWDIGTEECAEARLGEVGRPLTVMPRSSDWALCAQGREIVSSVVRRLEAED